MNIKEFCKKKHISIMQISQDTGLPYSTVNDIINGKVAIDNVAFGKCRLIARALQVSLDELYEMAQSSGRMQLHPDAVIIVKGKKYFLEYEQQQIYLCNVSEYTKKCVDEIASWMVDDIKSEAEIERLGKELLAGAY